MSKLRAYFLFLTIFPLLLLAACSGYSATGGPGPLVKRPLSTWSRPGVILPTLNQVVVMPLEGDAVIHLSEPQREGIQMDLSSAFSRLTELDIVNLSNSKEVSLALDDLQQGALAQRASDLAQRLSVQGVLYGTVSKYTQQDPRIETGVQPSNVAFRLYLMPVGSREPVWGAIFEASEQPLSDNLFRLPQALESGVAYKSSRRLIKEGFSQAATALQNQRQNGYGK